MVVPFSVGADVIAIESLLYAYEHSLRAFANEEAGAIARSVRHSLMQRPAVGLWEFPFKSIWDEFCHEAQIGPSDLRDAFDHLTDGLIRATLDRRTSMVLTLLSTGATLNTGDDPPLTENETLVADSGPAVMLVREHLGAMANDRRLDRFFV